MGKKIEENQQSGVILTLVRVLELMLLLKLISDAGEGALIESLFSSASFYKKVVPSLYFAISYYLLAIVGFAEC